MQKFFMLIGLPGSGKSTWCAQNTAPGVRIISTDDLIEKAGKELGLNYSQAFATLDFKTFETQMWADFHSALEDKADIIVDRTNMTPKSRARYLSQVGKGYHKTAVVFELDPALLQERLDARADATGKRIPPQVIASMTRDYTPPTLEEGFNAIIRV